MDFHSALKVCYMRRMDQSDETRDPFSISPDPTLLYQTPAVKAALHKVRYTIRRRQGLTSILGGVGMGKSTLVRYLFGEADADPKIEAKFIPSPNYTSEFAFLKAVSAEYGVSARGSMLSQEGAFKEMLGDAFFRGQNVVLFIDEAQRLSNKMLEVVRALLNFETNSRKLITIVIAGQLELADRLATRANEAIASRIVMPNTLNPLTPAETRALVEHRCAAVEVPVPFSADAWPALYDATDGIPREVLKIGAAAYELMRMAGEERISAELVRAAAVEGTARVKDDGR